MRGCAAVQECDCVCYYGWVMACMSERCVCLHLCLRVCVCGVHTHRSACVYLYVYACLVFCVYGCLYAQVCECMRIFQLHSLSACPGHVARCVGQVHCPETLSAGTS